jgi:lysine 2,3-aminomutase
LTPHVARLIDPSDPNDPIARQFLPDLRELQTVPEELTDPIGDARHSPLPGLVHRHADRVLLKLVNVCPVYCRFCFRREMVGPAHTSEQTSAPDLLAQARDYITAHPEIWEVIFTGGDPFILSARRAREAAETFAAIPHVKILRWHTRMPVVDPERVTEDFIRAIKVENATTIVVLHANHPRELEAPEAQAAIARLADAGIPLLSQSVLLKGVNDDLDTLELLMRRFVELRVKPYYLHHADLAPGTGHFRTTLETGRALMRGLRARASGLAQPTYVVDIPGGYAKALAASSDLAFSPDGRAQLRDGEDFWHEYKT